MAGDRDANCQTVSSKNEIFFNKHLQGWLQMWNYGNHQKEVVNYCNPAMAKLSSASQKNCKVSVALLQFQKGLHC